VLCALLYEAMETPLIALGHRLSKRLAASGEGVGVRPLEPARLD